jgi:hypothetical protein
MTDMALDAQAETRYNSRIRKGRALLPTAPTVSQRMEVR